MSKFGDAFKAARAAGKKDFEWGGTKYNTETSDDRNAKAAKSSVDRYTMDANDARAKRSVTMDANDARARAARTSGGRGSVNPVNAKDKNYGPGSRVTKENLGHANTADDQIADLNSQKRWTDTNEGGVTTAAYAKGGLVRSGKAGTRIVVAPSSRGPKPA